MQLTAQADQNTFRLLLPAVLIFVGCVHNNLQTYSQIDPAYKTVTVPVGAEGLKGELKRALAEMGWRLAVDRGPSVVEGSLGARTKLESYDSFKTRYRLDVTSEEEDKCFPNFQPLLRYEISFIDNQTGSEVFTLEGKGCQGDILKKFRQSLTPGSPK